MCVLSHTSKQTRFVSLSGLHHPKNIDTRYTFSTNPYGVWLKPRPTCQIVMKIMDSVPCFYRTP